jgi:hypothetical protein
VSLVEHLEERCVLSAAHAMSPHHALAVHRNAHAVHRSAAVSPAAAAGFQVQWTFPAYGQTVGGGPGFVAVSFTQLPDWTTATAQNVQLWHQNSDGSWAFVPSTVWVNPGNSTVVIAPIVAQPNGLYNVTLNPGLHSVTGASIGGPVYEFFSINDNWGTKDPITVFPSDNGETGVIVADQSRALDPSSVNAGTVQVYALNPNGSRGAQVPVTIVYDPNIPSIELALQHGLTAGTYQFVEHGVRDAAGNTLTATITRNFTIHTTQTPPGPDVLQNTPIAVAATFPSDGSTVSATPIASITFNQAADPSTVNTNTVQLVRWLPDQNRWSNPLPVAVTYNTLHSATIIPTAGLQLGNYLIAVNGVKDQLGRSMTAPQYFHYTFTHDTFYPVDARTFTAFPSTGQTYNGTPPAILVFLQKFAGSQASSINTNNVQLLPWLGNHTGNPLPIGVAYNPWPGAIVISPFFSIGDGVYVIQVNGVKDLAGNVQNGPYSSWFVVTGTGRPQSL